MIGIFSNYYNECYDGTICKEDEHYGDRMCCNIDDNECWDCSDYDEDETVLVIVASVLSLVASLFSGFLIPQQYTVQKKLNMEFQSPQLIQHAPQNIQVSNPQQVYQQGGYQTQQAAYQNPVIQQGQPFQPAAYYQPTQQQGYYQPQPGGHQQQAGYGYQNNPNQFQNAGGQ